jgi:fatty acyl-ACP thioesterase B
MLFDAADMHAHNWKMSLGQLSETTQTWVLSRLHVRLERQPGWDETVGIETWAAGSRRMFAGRDYRIRAGDSDVGRASTLWLMIDRATRQPVALPDFIREIKAPEDSPVVPFKAGWRPDVDGPNSVEVQVSWNDLDLNQHATALSYLDWLMMPLPSGIQSEQSLLALDLQFREEAFEGDRVRVAVGPTDREEAVFAHVARRVTDESIVALARSAWGPDQISR